MAGNMPRMRSFLQIMALVTSLAYGVQGLPQLDIGLPGGPELTTKAHTPCITLADCAGAVCPPSAGYASCGQDGICYCTNQNMEYDGVKAAAFSNTAICTKQTKDSKSKSCFMTCSKRKGSVSTTLDSYLCTEGLIHRCWCDYKIERENFAPCNKNETCAENDKMMNICIGSSTCLFLGINRVITAPHDCLCAGGFSKTSSKYCQDDTFCFNTCKGIGNQNGKACSSTSMGARACFCTRNK